jgi:hypothetical protein
MKFLFILDIVLFLFNLNCRAKPSSRNTDTEKSVESTEEAETGPNASNDVDLTPKQGTGRITSSGTTIHGHFTKFMDELKSGDARKFLRSLT